VGWDMDRPSKEHLRRMAQAGWVGREIVGEKRKKPITDTTIPLAKRDMQVKHNYKTPGHHGWIAFRIRTA
jgi:hypothetical protein